MKYARILLLLYVFSSCASLQKNPSFDHNFCYVGKNGLACSEKQPDGSFLTVDHDFEYISRLEGMVLIPIEDFESRFGQKK